MSDRTMSPTWLPPAREAAKSIANTKGDWNKIAAYMVERCGDFTYDSERADFIAAFLEEAHNGSDTSAGPQEAAAPVGPQEQE